VREGEEWLEQKVTAHIGAMPFLWLAVEDPPSRETQRGYIERHAIALLSGMNVSPDQQIDPSCRSWLGLFSDRENVRRSGLWNNRHVTDPYNPDFLDLLEHLVAIKDRGGA
jgi:hypothetical protein